MTRTTERSQGGEYAEEKGLKASGVVSIINGSFVVPKSSGVDSDNPSELKDQVILDDLIVDGSIGVGMDAVNGEAFGFDTIRLKENNLRIKFQDTSNSASFPTNDWQITANDSSNGGANKFSIDDIDGGRTPFTILAGAPSHSLFVHNTGRLGLGTSTPVVELHMVDGDSPTMRLQQDGSSGFTPQTWDVAGNETNFFIRDATNGSTLPFRIMASAPKDAFVIAADGDIGIGTASPTEGAQLDVIGNLRVDGNIEQTGNFSFAGDFGVGTTTPSAKLDVVGNLEVNGNTEVTGNLGMGTASPAAPVHILRSDNTAKLLIEDTGSSAQPMLELKNYAAPQLVFNHTDEGETWTLEATDAENFKIISSSEGGAVFTMNNGDLIIPGTVTSGGSTYHSDFNIKNNIVPVDAKDMFKRVAGMPISTWSYKSDQKSVRHMGPMSQDFKAAFNLGDNDTSINVVDAGGVALAAIQGIGQVIEEKNAEIDALKLKSESMEKQLELLMKEVQSLKEKN